MIGVEPGLYRGHLGEYIFQMRTVLDLHSTSDNAEALECFNHNIVRVVLAMCPIFPPNEKMVAEAMIIINESKRPLFVHCRKGRDRTGFIIAKYRMACGWTRGNAKKEMIQLGSSWWLRWWTWFL